MDRCGFQTVLKIPFQQWSVQNDFFGLKGRQQAFVGRAWFFFLKQRRCFFKLLPHLSGHLAVYLGKAKPFALLQKSAKRFDVSWRLRPMHNYLLATGHAAQHCAWVQRVGVVAKNFSTQPLALEFV